MVIIKLRKKVHAHENLHYVGIIQQINRKLPFIFPWSHFQTLHGQVKSDTRDGGQCIKMSPMQRVIYH